MANGKCEAAADETPRSEWLIPLLLVAGAVVVVALRPFTDSAWSDTFTAYFLAIILSATPYILLGACLSGVVEVFLPPTLLVRITRRLGRGAVLATALVAPLFPICECGIIAVVRGLLRKGLPLNLALTYLLAAPIVNPIVLLSTYTAFQDFRHPIFRTLGGLLVATAIGYAFSRVKPERALRASFLNEASEGDSDHHAEDTLSHLVQHVRKDFLDMMPFFLMGVFIASGMKTFLSERALSMAAASPVWGPASMMLMAFVLSLCSEADAFPAASFTAFSLTAHMGFLVLGPMLDIKLLLMYRTVFKTGFIVVFALSIIAGVSAYVALLGLLL